MIKVNGIPVNVTKFSDNTSQVWKLPLELFELNTVHVEWSFENEAEFMHLAQLKDLLDSKNIKATLYMDYLPYGRQDKEICNKSTFALNTFARLLKGLNFEKVIALDMHSRIDATKYIVDRLPYGNALHALKSTDANLLCFPDAGARTRYSNLLTQVPTIYAEKTRDQLTGEITKVELVGSPVDRTVLIVDDICDGGGTFIKVADLLYNAGAKEVNLYTTHGIYSKGLRPILDSGINRIFNKNGEVFECNNIISYKLFGENNKWKT